MLKRLMRMFAWLSGEKGGRGERQKAKNKRERRNIFKRLRKSRMETKNPSLPEKHSARKLSLKRKLRQKTSVVSIAIVQWEKNFSRVDLIL